jgi:O-antigen/teichoic acid export membrane protein
VVKKIAYTLFTRGFVAIALLLNLILSSRFLGSEVVGQMSLLILNMAIIHTVAEIYTGSSMVFFIPRVCFKTLYLRGFAWILLCVSIISGVFYAASPMIRPLIAHLVVLALLSALHNFHTYLVLGRQAIRSYNVLVFFQPISAVLILSIAVFGMQDKSINASLLALYGSYGGSVLLSLFLLRRLPAQEGEQATPSWKALLQLGFTNQLANLAHLLSNRYNYYIIAGISTSLVGVLSSGTSLIESVWTVSAAISPLVLSKVANSEAGQEEARLSLQLAKLSFLLSFVAVIILLFIPVQWFTQILGADFEAVKLVMLLLSPGVLALSFSSVLSHYYSGLGRQRVLLAANSSGLAITLLTSYWLISRYGLAGACVAASLAYAMQCLVLAIVFWRERSHLA